MTKPPLIPDDHTPPATVKVQFGCGPHKLDGWDNRDIKTDIRRPFPDSSVDFIFAEHMIEHVSSREGFRFLIECHRILKPSGVLRLVFPDILKIANNPNDVSNRWQHISAVIQDWGHCSVWSYETGRTMLNAAGFDCVYPEVYSDSRYPDLRNIERHHISSKLAKLESTILEAIK